MNGINKIQLEDIVLKFIKYIEKPEVNFSGMFCFVLFGLSILVSSQFSNAAETKTIATKIEKNVQSWSVGLGATRIIYDPSSPGAVISVNNPNDYPVLVQSKVSDASHQGVAHFIVTPPLFRLDAHQQSNLRVVMTDDVAAKDRETLYWLCATGIPPELGDEWAKEENKAPANTAVLNVKIKASQCIKVLVRPRVIKGRPEQEAMSVTWTVESGKLKATNPTPYYMNIISLNVDGRSISQPELIAPMSSTTYLLDGKQARKIIWKIVNDFGGESGPYESSVR